MASPTFAAGTAGLPELTLTAYFIPISVIAAWPKTVSIHIETRRWYIPFAAALQALATIIVFIRFYGQFSRRIRNFGLDDIFIIAAWLVSIGYTAATVWGTIHAGFDRHVWDNLSKGELSGLMAWVGEILFLSSTCLTKLSVLAFQRRLLQKTQKTRFIRAIDAGFVFVIAYFFIFLALLIFACNPVNASWKSLDLRWQKPYKCRHRLIADTLAGVFSVISDIYALILPEILVYSLRIDKRQKLILSFVFGSGLIVAGAGIARTYYLYQLSTDRLRDMTWVGYEILVWGGLEMQMAIICASAPAIKAFISNFKSGTVRSRSSKTNSTPLTPLSKGRSEGMQTQTMDSEFADSKGILVTETLSLKSAVATPMSAQDHAAFAFPSPLDAKLSPHEAPPRSSYSSESALHASFYVPTAQGQQSEGLPLATVEDWNDPRASFADAPQTSHSQRTVSMFRPYNERDKAMKILGE